MTPTVKDLRKQIGGAEVLSRKLREALAALQEVCEHDWGYEGHSHNDDLYTCNNCGKEEWR